MRLRRWNYGNKTYEPFEIPEDWNVKLVTDNMEELVNCPNCGSLLPFGDTYTSKEIHNWVGLGYWVCEKCHEEEMGRYINAKGRL